MRSVLLISFLLLLSDIIVADAPASSAHNGVYGQNEYPQGIIQDTTPSPQPTKKGQEDAAKTTEAKNATSNAPASAPPTATTTPPAAGVKTPATTETPASISKVTTNPQISQSAKNGGIRFVTYNNMRYVYLRDMAAYYKMQSAVNSKNCTLSGKAFKLSMLYDKNYAYFNDLLVHLFYPPVSKNGDALISEADFLRQIDPIIRNFAVPRHALKTIMIDPGHGGNDEGARGKMFREKDVALRLGLKLKAVLEKMGYTVAMTRTTDRTLTLEQRVEYTTKAKADLFVSIHCNKADNRAVCGLETFVLPALGAQSTYGSNNNGRAPGNQFDSNNSRLGYEIHGAVKDATGTFDRGLKRARFYVIRNTSCPAVLIETGFLSNRFEERRLGDNAYQDKVVDGIAEGIFNYHRSMLK